jgi:hypothetical protein
MEGKLSIAKYASILGREIIKLLSGDIRTLFAVIYVYLKIIRHIF